MPAIPMVINTGGLDISKITITGHINYSSMRITFGSASRGNGSGNTAYFTYVIDVKNKTGSLSGNSGSGSHNIGAIYYSGETIYIRTNLAVYIDSISFE